MESLVDNRLAELLNRNLDQLTSLPASSTDVVKLEGKDVKMTVYHDRLENDCHRVVVQAVRERWMGMTARVVAKGFQVSSDGMKRTLEPEELYDFT